ncbi:MAG: hypothetical protein FWG03_06050 [Clostridiales bacterium]|nr:hypothetical protein [Clostridiales bacterium]
MSYSENTGTNIISVTGPVILVLVIAFTMSDTMYFASFFLSPIVPTSMTVFYFSHMDIRFCYLIMSVFPSLCMWLGMNNKRYVKNYFAAVGLRKDPTYEKVNEVFGDPEKVITVGPGFTAIKYEGIEFLVMEKQGSAEGGIVSAVRIYSAKYRFGRWKMAVGFSREDIEKIYKGFRRVIGLDCGFFDGRYCIGFEFDENQLVNKIVVYDNGAKKDRRLFCGLTLHQEAGS